jgi:hypothetical protein
MRKNVCLKTKTFASKDTFFIKLIFTDNYYNQCNIVKRESRWIFINNN